MATTTRPAPPATGPGPSSPSEIKAVARRQLAEQGSAALSLRAVARELGMVSSAVYRYFPSRDDLLTALIIDAYDAVGEAAEAADAAAAPRRRAGAVAGRDARRSARWALAEPARVRARSTAAPCPATPRRRTRSIPRPAVSLVCSGIVRRRRRRGRDRRPATAAADAAAGARRLRRARATCAAPGRARRGAARAACWRGPSCSARISFEMFGHLHNVIHDYDALLRRPDARRVAAPHRRVSSGDVHVHGGAPNIDTRTGSRRTATKPTSGPSGQIGDGSYP